VDTDQQTAPSVVSVMVVHEPGEWFEETVAALAAQDYPNLRSLFLLAPAPDDELADTTARIRRVMPSAFIRELGANVGFGPAVNEVLRLVEGDNGFFLISHDDIAPEPQAVRIMVSELFRSNAGIVGPKLTDWEQPRVLQHVGLGLDRFGEVDPLVSPGEVDQEQHDAVRDVFVLPSACMLVRADLFRALGGFDPSISFHGDDVELCWRAHLTGARVVVAPDARVRHIEALDERRPDLNHGTLRSRHRMRAVATLTGGSRLVGRSLQMVLLTVVEVVVGLFTGRLGEALSSLRALVGLIPRTPAIAARRRSIRGQRMVPEREVLGLQGRGSSRLTSYLRGKETATYVNADTTVRRWREASFGPTLAWFCFVIGVVIGTREFISNGVPPVGEFLPFPESPGRLLSEYRSSFDPRSYGSTAPVPTGWAALAVLSSLTLFRMPLLMTVSLVGMYLLGGLGAWRLATVFPSNRARIACMVVYVGCPLVPGLLGSGSLGALVWFAACPWLLHLVRRVAGLETADPSADVTDLTDGVAAVGARHRVRAAAFATLVLALAAAFAPVVVVLFAAAGVTVALATLLAGGAWRVAGWMVVGTLAPAVLAVALNLPWSLGWRWDEVAGAPVAGASGRSFLGLASLAPDGVRFSALAIALYVPVVVALAITRAWRLTWSSRGAALVVVFGGLIVVADRGATDIALPPSSMLAVPVALGLGLCAAALAGGFGADVLRRGFGWRQPAGLLGYTAIVIGLVPGVVAIGDGGWGTPRTPLTTYLSSQLPIDPEAGDYRVLYVGDPRVLPVPGREYEPGIAYAVVDSGPFEFTDRFPVAESEGNEAVERALRLVAEGATLRAGRLLAPHGIRYVVLVETDGVVSTAEDPIAMPDGVLAAFQNQLDVGPIPDPGLFEVFENGSWMPVAGRLTGATAEASRLGGDAVVVRSDLSAVEPVLPGADRDLDVAGAVGSGVVHLAVPFDARLHLDVDGTRLAPRPAFGLTTAFDVPADDAGVVAELRYDEGSSRSLWLAVQFVLWLAVLVVAAGARATFGRRRGLVVHDETIIELDDGDLTSMGLGPALGGGVAGEVLGRPTWAGEDAWPEDEPMFASDDTDLPDDAAPDDAVPDDAAHDDAAHDMVVPDAPDVPDATSSTVSPVSTGSPSARLADIANALRGFEAGREDAADDDEEVDLASLVRQVDDADAATDHGPDAGGRGVQP
jgi:GT2 family glycosyltransferase